MKPFQVKKTINKYSYNKGHDERYMVTFNKEYHINFGLFDTSYREIDTDLIEFSSYNAAKDYIDNVDIESMIKRKSGDFDVFIRTEQHIVLRGIIRHREIMSVLKNAGYSHKYRIEYNFGDHYNGEDKTKRYTIYMYNKTKHQGEYMDGNSLTSLINSLVNALTYTKETCLSVISTNGSMVPINIEGVSKIEKERKAIIKDELKRIEDYKKMLESLLD